MFYSHWENKNNMKNCLQKIDYKKSVNQSGLPIIYEGNSIYTTGNDGHSLVIGTSGSGKVQTIVLPVLKLSLLAGESVVVNDSKGELYNNTALEFKNRGYNVVVLDFDNAIYGNYFNPLSLALNLYKGGNIDKCISVIEEIGYYIFTDTKRNIDPFWDNSAIDFFIGLCLYLIKHAKKDVTFNDVFDLADKLSDKKECDLFLKKLKKNDSIYYNISGTLTAPEATKGGILATFNQKIKKLISKKNLSTMMSKTDFDISNISNNKTIVYIVSGCSDYSSYLIPLFVNEMFNAIKIYNKHDMKVNVILDEFDKMMPIKNFNEIINYARSIRINFTCIISSFVSLTDLYGKENVEIIKLCYSNVIYLYANDLHTLETISNLCGNESSKSKLVSPEELRVIPQFNAICILQRVMPFKTKLLPDYQINWGIKFETSELKLRK